MKEFKNKKSGKIVKAKPTVSGGSTASEKPVKEDDHALDALRYALFTHSPMKLDTGEDFSLYESSYN